MEKTGKKIIDADFQNQIKFKVFTLTDKEDTQ